MKLTLSPRFLLPPANTQVTSQSLARKSKPLLLRSLPHVTLGTLQTLLKSDVFLPGDLFRNFVRLPRKPLRLPPGYALRLLQKQVMVTQKIHCGDFRKHSAEPQEAHCGTPGNTVQGPPEKRREDSGNMLREPPKHAA